jgi:hypothetical protein
MLHRVLITCLLLTCAPLTACGGDKDPADGGGGAGKAVWPGLSKNLDCGGLDSGVPAELIVDYQGASYSFTAHVSHATEESVAVRLVCQNKADPSEALAATLEAEVRNDLLAQSYDIAMPSHDEDEAADGWLELRSVDGYLSATRTATGAEASAAGYEKRNDSWAARYETDSGLPASDETRSKFGWTEDIEFEVASVRELSEDEQDTAVTSMSFRTHEIHGTIAIHGVFAANGTIDAADTDGRDTIEMRAEF